LPTPQLDSEKRLHTFSLRQLKAVLRVAELCNVTQAAHSLSRSQTAITKSVSEVENTLGYHLFDRSSTGLTPTVYGTALAARLKSIQVILERANSLYREHHSNPKPIQQIPIFTMDLSARRMAVLIALSKSGTVKQASGEMKLTPSAIYKFLHELELQLDLRIFEKLPQGILKATDFGTILLSSIKLVFAELRHAVEDLRNIDGRVIGRVNIGTMPSTRAVLTPVAIERMTERLPNIKITTWEAPYNELIFALASGDIDMIVTGTRPLTDTDGIKSIDLFEDRLCLVAQSDHPLFKHNHITAEQLSKERWVVHPMSTPAGRVFADIMDKMGLSQDVIGVETLSIMILRRLLLNSNFITIVSAQQTEIERTAGTISILPVELPDDKWPVGALVRDHTKPSPAARAFLEQLKRAAAEIKPYD